MSNQNTTTMERTAITPLPSSDLLDAQSRRLQRVVSLLRSHRFKLIAAGLVAMSYCVPKDDPSGLTMCAAAMCAAYIDYELQKQANDEVSDRRAAASESSETHNGGSLH